MEPLGMFELSKIALPLLAISLGFLVLFGRRLLPEREALSNIISDIDRKEFLTEAVVLEGSPLLGKKIGESEIASLSGVRVLDVVRKGNQPHQAFLSLYWRSATASSCPVVPGHHRGKGIGRR